MATSSYNSITVAIWTMDPVGIYTCSSNQALNFNYSNGLISYSTRSKGQWDGQPTGRNTNWYLNYNNFGTFNQGSSTVSTSISAQHYNYDFMDKSLYTYANHYITLYGYGSGSTDYSVDCNYSGEYSYALGAEVDVF